MAFKNCINKMIFNILNYNEITYLSTEDLKSLKWLSIANRVKYLAAGHVYECPTGHVTDY